MHVCVYLCSMLVEMVFGERIWRAHPTKSLASSIFRNRFSLSASVSVFESKHATKILQISTESELLSRSALLPTCHFQILQVFLSGYRAEAYPIHHGSWNTACQIYTPVSITKMVLSNEDDTHPVQDPCPPHRCPGSSPRSYTRPGWTRTSGSSRSYPPQNHSDPCLIISIKKLLLFNKIYYN